MRKNLSVLHRTTWLSRRSIAEPTSDTPCQRHLVFEFIGSRSSGLAENNKTDSIVSTMTRTETRNFAGRLCRDNKGAADADLPMAEKRKKKQSMSKTSQVVPSVCHEIPGKFHERSPIALATDKS